MSEYLAPGVYIEEVSFRSKSIEGVPTSTTGFAGMTRYGPVQYPGGPTDTEPRLVTSFTEFERLYGGLEPLHMPTDADGRIPYLAHAARAFFLNGGKRLYVSRVFAPRGGGISGWGVASRAIAVSGTNAIWTARWPGVLGNVWVETQIVRSTNIAFASAAFGGIVQVNRVTRGAIVEVIPSGTPPAGNDALTLGTLAEIDIDPIDGRQFFRRGGVTFLPAMTDIIQLVEARVVVQVDAERVDVYDELGTHPDQPRYVGRILQRDNPEHEGAVVWLDWDPAAATATDVAASLMVALQQHLNPRLQGGHDGMIASPDDLLGHEADPGDASNKATGIEALGEIEDIAIVALPDSGAYAAEEDSLAAADRLIRHAERMRYRIAVVDGRPNSSMTEIRRFRGQFDSKYAALYHPWIEILHPLESTPPQKLLLPPSGFVCGIYARSDVERGVHKAPANEIVRGLTKLEIDIDQAQQDVLNSEGINALRFFEGRGTRVWGARTLSSDPEWKYVNIRRLFIYLEHSIDKGTQWAVFEPNNERLWRNVRQTVEDFLFGMWRDGALIGDTPENAYFVRCDRTTMTQNDLDNGRLVCLVGVAPTKPAEFVVFRIGQWTSDTPQTTPDPLTPGRHQREGHMPTLRDTPYRGFNFIVALGRPQENIIGGFSDVSGLGVDVSYSEHRNDTERFNPVRKVPNTHKHNDIILKRGLIGSDLVQWLKGVRDGTIDRRNVTITLLDEARNPVATFMLRNALPKKWVGPTLAAKGGSEVAMEELHLVHEGIVTQ